MPMCLPLHCPSCCREVKESFETKRLMCESSLKLLCRVCPEEPVLLSSHYSPLAWLFTHCPHAILSSLALQVLLLPLRVTTVHSHSLSCSFA